MLFIRGALPAAVVLAVVLSFWPSLDGRFVNWDDDTNFLKNRNYRGFSPENLEWMWTETSGHFMPLTWMSLALDHTLWGMEPFGYHVTNLVLHGVNAVLCHLFLLALLGRSREVAAAVGALFFAIHPLRVESVAWITERRDLLSGTFFLLCLLAYLRAQRTARWRWIAFSAGLFLCSLLSKMMGMMLPFALLVMDAWPLRRFSKEPVGRILAEKIPFFLLLAGAVTMTYLSQDKVGALREASEYAWTDRLTQPGYRLCFYAWKEIVPTGLAPLYLFRPVKDGGAFVRILCGLMVAVAAVALFRWRRRWPAGAAAIAAFTILLFPALGAAVQAGPHFAADRYTYLASLPLAALVAGAVAWGRARRPAAAVVAGMVGCVVLGAMTFEQSKIWADSGTMWDQVLRVDPDVYIAYNSRGGARHAKGDLDGAIVDYTLAIRQLPDYAKAHNNRGVALMDKGDLGAAIADFDAALRIDPEFAEAHYNRGLARHKRGDLEGAVTDYTEAIRLKPDYVEAHSNRGAAWSDRGNFRQAREDATSALKILPTHPEALGIRGHAHLALENYAGAIEDLEKALQSAPPDWPQRGVTRELLEIARRKGEMGK